MAIDSTYAKLLIDDHIKQQLSSGVALTANDIIDAVNELLEDNDLTVPQFDAAAYAVEKYESASAAKHNSTFGTALNDLRALYKEMLVLTQNSTESLERWDLESAILEKRLIDLEERIDNLLILTQDTEGYHSIIVDNFTDTKLFDQVNSTAEIDLSTQSVKMGSTATTATRIFLNNINPKDHVKFKVRNTTDFLARNDSQESEITYLFLQTSRSWWTNVIMKNKSAVTCELTVKISDTPIDVSRIDLSLLDSVEASPLYITPLYSVDNISFNQLPTNTFTQEVRTSATFAFNTVQAQYIKFIMTKRGSDASSSTASTFAYQFGFKSISFFAEGFSADTIQTFYSNPLSVQDQNGNIADFERLTLETCERLETDTTIKYFVTASNDSTVPLGSATWFYIEPVQRSQYLAPTIVEIGDAEDVVIGDTETVQISYDKAGAAGFIKPDADFNLLSLSSGDVVESAESASSITRYSFLGECDFILNYQIKDTVYTGSGTDAFEFNPNKLTVFRNVGEKGLVPSVATNRVRNVLRGWKYEDPYYVTTIEIENPEGIILDVGDQAIIVDDVFYRNKIDKTVLTGKTSVQSGIHIIKVHKNNWRHVTPSLDTLAELKLADPLYPYNHKLLIEGYLYGGAYPTTSEKVYTGVDLFAEASLSQTSVFDFQNNIKPSNYNVFALDRDAPESHDAGNDPTVVFLVKANDENPDFINERFVLKFRKLNQQYKYLRIRADFETENEALSPELHGYKVKLA